MAHEGWHRDLLRCVECGARAEFHHHENDVAIYSCAAHKCVDCVAL